ncbi:MAG: MarR family transcriptional regulator [Paludibacter sp.]|nr:MarR family transcriptional regulator [Paludibacter sp.]
MNNPSYKLTREPIGRKMSKIAKMYQTKLQDNLVHLDIDRSFYPLLLIATGNGITQQQLADKLFCDKVQVVRIIDYLSSNGYVERIQSTCDKRKYELAVTEKANLVLGDIDNALASASNVAFNSLSESQIEELYGMLTIIEMNLLEDGK